MIIHFTGQIFILSSVLKETVTTALGKENIQQTKRTLETRCGSLVMGTTAQRSLRGSFTMNVGS